MTPSFAILALFAWITIKIDAFGYENCTSYNDLESEVHCGENGYLLKYGLVYCQKFFTPEYYNQFDAAGQQFLTCTGECLLNTTSNIVNNQVASNAIYCKKIDNQAIDSHSECYSACGFCNICRKNTIALLHVFNLLDFADPRILSEALGSISKCGLRCII